MHVRSFQFVWDGVRSFEVDVGSFEVRVRSFEVVSGHLTSFAVVSVHLR